MRAAFSTICPEPSSFRKAWIPSGLQKAFEDLIREEELLRAGFRQEAEGIFAFVEPSVSFRLTEIRASSLEEAMKTL